MACLECREVKKLARQIDKISNDKIHKYYTHAMDCIHHANFCLIRLLSSIKMQQETLFVNAFLYHEGPFRYYVLKNKPLFQNFWSRIIMDVRKNDFSKLMRILGNFTFIKKKQINWILQEPSLLNQFNELCEFLNTYLQTGKLERDASYLICFYLHHLSLKGLYPNKSYTHIKKHVIDEYNYRQSISIMKILVHATKKCGNVKCKKDYIFDCFGTEAKNFSRNDDDPFWDTVRINKKWKICKGCKTTYYCSRKCQKISWIQGHKQKCQTLQKLMIHVDEEFVILK